MWIREICISLLFPAALIIFAIWYRERSRERKYLAESSVRRARMKQASTPVPDGMVACKNCSTHVVALADRTCPACHHNVDVEPPPQRRKGP